MDHSPMIAIAGITASGSVSHCGPGSPMLSRNWLIGPREFRVPCQMSATTTGGSSCGRKNSVRNRPLAHR